jgi:formylglycine-generating enzyme required for sulfatase activity
MRFPRIIAAAWLMLLSAAAAVYAEAAHAEKRVALVIGNDRYVYLPEGEQLQKAVNDARSVGAVLKDIGFDVISGENLGRGALVGKLDELIQRLAPGDTAFFFFSGHGVALDGVNYILPADVPDVAAGQETRLKGEAIGEQYIISELNGRGVRVSVVVLDACRTNPFGRTGAKGIGGSKGLARPPQVQGTFSLYAASSGQAALDRLYDGDPDPNSVFSRVLAPMLAKPGVDLATLAFEVREEVARIAQKAGQAQRPAYYDETIGGRIYLAGAPQEKDAAKNPAKDLTGGGQPTLVVTEVTQAWGAVQNATSIAVIDDFIRQFGDVPVYGSLARARREELAKEASKEAGREAAKVPPKESAKTQVAVVGSPMRSSADPCNGPVTVSFPSRCAAPLTAVQERGLKAKDTFRECDTCPEMVMLPAGSFTMGSPETEADRLPEEGPQHVVTIRVPFAVGRLHVTVDQFTAFAKETGRDADPKCWTYERGTFEERAERSWRNPGFAQGGSHPAVCLSWNDAKAYADWLAKKTGKPYRLMSEAEWEYAARGRTTPGAYPRFWFGDDDRTACRYANSADQKLRDAGLPKDWAFGACNDGFAYTAPAGRYEPNAFGLSDIAGNAWQWTADCWHDTYEGAPADGSAWTDGSCSGGHVVRGGSWYTSPKFLRSAHRTRYPNAGNGFGLRVARSIGP